MRKITYPEILFLALVFIGGCSEENTSSLKPTTAYEPRPISEYEVGRWHEKLSNDITSYANKILTNSGFNEDQIEVELLPAETINDELIIIKHKEWKNKEDFSLLHFWVYSSIQVEVEKYKLNPELYIDVTCGEIPCGNFNSDNAEILSFCEIPIPAIDEYIRSDFQNLQTFQTFLSKWNCTHRQTEELDILPTLTPTIGVETSESIPLYMDPSYHGRPTLYPPKDINCVFWKKISESDIGRNICFYGKVIEINEHNLLVGDAPLNSIIVFIDKIEHPYFKGDCHVIKGEVGQIDLTSKYSSLVIDDPELEKYGSFETWCFNN